MQDPGHWALVPFSVLSYFRSNKKLIVQELIPKPPDRITYMINHRFPRIAAKQGIEILESQARKLGFFGSSNQADFGEGVNS
jgi:hypothetical protein